MRAALLDDLLDARTRSLELLDDLPEEAWLGPRLLTVNPPRWEFGHVAWFQERWVLREGAGRTPVRPDGDALFDSSAVPHHVRWDLPLPTRAEALAYAQEILERVRRRLDADDLTTRDLYFARLAVVHEDMHGEAFAMARQTLAYPAPRGARASEPARAPTRPARDVHVPAARIRLGRDGTEPFVFDNEAEAHEVEVGAFRIADRLVTEGEFFDFVEAGGYEEDGLWSDAGLAWRRAHRVEGPAATRRSAAGGFERRRFDRFVPAEPARPMLLVGAFEAEAYARFVGRRLPTEAEWELAASGAGSTRRSSLEAAPDALDGRADWAPPVGREAGHPSDGRIALGGAWEWTSSPFRPYPGFVAGPYADYSRPWFDSHRVLRGGSFVTRRRLVRATLRNFYTPDRRDVFAGIRTCARDP